MHYYEVLVGAMSYHGNEALTYSAEELLQAGQIVRVPLRARRVLGIVVQKVHKPSFAVKPLTPISSYPPLPSQSLELLRWVHGYYPAPLGAVVRLFVPPTEALSINLKPSTKKQKPTTKGFTVDSLQLMELPPLTADQQQALDRITGPGTFVLHGITGSGKSRVYVELAARALTVGKSALVLTPEIGLTAQLTKTFRDAFGDQNVYVLHSQLTAAQRRDIWYEILGRTTPAIVIGPRSALFSPLRGVALVVLDESHSDAYKNESAPHYQANRVAAKLAALHGATLVLGSATPDVQDYYLAQAKGRPIIAMDNLAMGSSSINHQASTIHMVDMKQHENFTRSPLISNRLVEAVGAALQKGEQSLLYLNRRGTANVVLCNVCGWQSVCPNCDLALTYHGDAHELRCHVCGYHSPAPTSCPVCGNTDIVFKSVGTKAVVDAVHKLFPSARLQRFDTDAKKAERLEHHVEALADGGADIIVGTQMIGKGLDLPKLSVVGIVNADSSLLIPDYTAAEQTYQLISQVVGRVGRGHRPGTVVVQSYNPTNPTLLAAVNRQWQAFYDVELAERKAYRFPPFINLLKLRVLRATNKSAETAALAFAKQLHSTYPNITVDGPAPSFHPRERGKYSWQLLVRSASRSTLIDIIHSLPSGWQYDIDPINLL